MTSLERPGREEWGDPATVDWDNSEMDEPIAQPTDDNADTSDSRALQIPPSFDEVTSAPARDAMHRRTGGVPPGGAVLRGGVVPETDARGVEGQSAAVEPEPAHEPAPLANERDARGPTLPETPEPAADAGRKAPPPPPPPGPPAQTAEVNDEPPRRVFDVREFKDDPPPTDDEIIAITERFDDLSSGMRDLFPDFQEEFVDPLGDTSDIINLTYTPEPPAGEPAPQDPDKILLTVVAPGTLRSTVIVESDPTDTLCHVYYHGSDGIRRLDYDSDRLAEGMPAQGTVPEAEALRIMNERSQEVGAHYQEEIQAGSNGSLVGWQEMEHLASKLLAAGPDIVSARQLIHYIEGRRSQLQAMPSAEDSIAAAGPFEALFERIVGRLGGDPNEPGNLPSIDVQTTQGKINVELANELRPRSPFDNTPTLRPTVYVTVEQTIGPEWFRGLIAPYAKSPLLLSIMNRSEFAEDTARLTFSLTGMLHEGQERPGVFASMARTIEFPDMNQTVDIPDEFRPADIGEVKRLLSFLMGDPPHI